MSNIRFIGFICVLLMSMATAYAQQTTAAVSGRGKDKLSQRYVVKIVQDKQGFLWVGTFDGINRFDGDTYLQFKKSFDPPYHISDREIKNMLVLGNGHLAIHYNSGWKGIDIFNVVDFELNAVDLSALMDSTESILDIQTSEDGQLLVMISSADNSRLLVIDDETQISEKYSVNHKEQSASVYRHTAVSDWLVLKNGKVIEIDQSGQMRRSFFVPPHAEKSFLRKKLVHFIELEPDGEFIFSFEAVPGIYSLTPTANEPSINSEFGHTDEYFRWIENDRSGNRLLFAGTSFTRQSNLFLNPKGTRELMDVSDRNETRNEATCAFGEDFKKGFFLGTVDHLNRVNFTPNYFKKLLQQPVVPGQWGMSSRGIAKDAFQNLIVAREINDWFRISPDGNIDTLAILGDRGSFQANMKCSRDLVEYNSNIYGSVHLENDSFMLLIFDPVTQNTRSLPIAHHIQKLSLGQNMIWIGCGQQGKNGALYKFYPNENRLEQYLEGDGTNPFSEIEIQSIVVDENEIWIGGHGGIFKLSLEDQKTIAFSNENQSLFDDKYVVVNDMMLHSDGHLYVGYAENGFDVFDLSRRNKKNFSVQNGLAQENIALIVEDNNGNVWLGTYNGLSRFNPITEQFTNFYEEDGIPHNEFNRFSSAKDEEGNIFMGSLNGIVYFNPEEIASANKLPRLLINSLKYFDKRGEELEHLGTFSEKMNISVPAGYRSLNISLSMDNYFSAKGNHYQYQIGDTIPTKWVDNGSNKELSLNFLRSGNYPLYVRGVQQDGQISANLVQLDLDVRQFFYESIWFYISLAILATALAFLFFRNRFMQKLKVVNMRQEISRDLHDEVGSLLTGIAMKTDLLAMKVNDVNKVEVNKLSRMGREAVRQMRDIVWSIDNKKNSIGDLTDRIREFADEVLLERGISYQIDFGGYSPNQQIPQEVRKNIYLVVREAMNNIVKHSNATKVEIRMNKRSDICHVNVTDNGTTAEKKIGKSGLGLKNMNERSEKIGGYIDIKYENGFKVNLTFPSFA